MECESSIPANNDTYLMDYLHDYDNYTNTYSILIQSGWVLVSFFLLTIEPKWSCKGNWVHSCQLDLIHCRRPHVNFVHLCVVTQTFNIMPSYCIVYDTQNTKMRIFEGYRPTQGLFTRYHFVSKQGYQRWIFGHTFSSKNRCLEWNEDELIKG